MGRRADQAVARAQFTVRELTNSPVMGRNQLEELARTAVEQLDQPRQHRRQATPVRVPARAPLDRWDEQSAAVTGVEVAR